MATKRIGLWQLEEQPGRKITRDYFGVWTIDTTFSCKQSSLLQSMPAPLSAHPTYAFAKLIEVTGVEEEGECAMISCQYRGLQTTESVHRLTVLPATVDDPVETFPLFAELNQEEHKYIRDYLDQPAGVPTVYDLSPEGLILLDKKLRGQEAYVNQGLTLRDTYYRKTQFREIREIKITAPPAGAPDVPTGCNWLLVPGAGEQEGGAVKIEDEYRLSGPRGWDPIFYS